MADEAASAPVVGEERNATAEAAEVEERPKDTRSIEERMAALKKPTPVPQPNEEKLNQQLSALNAKIDKCDKRLVILVYILWDLRFLMQMVEKFAISKIA
jgi:hypothetical protein